MMKRLLLIACAVSYTGCATAGKVVNEDPAVTAARLKAEQDDKDRKARAAAYGEALAAFDAKSFGDARDKARLAMQAAPDDAKLKRVLAMALTQLGSPADSGPFAEADALFESLRKADLKNVGLALAHCDLYRRRNAKGDVTKGLNTLRTLAKADPYNPKLLATMVVFYRLQGRVTKAEKLITKILSRHPDSIAAYMNLSMIYFGRAQTAKGKEKSVALARAENVTNLAFAKLKLAKVKIVAEHAPFYNNLGMIWVERGDLGRSLIQFEKALELDPNLIAAHRNIGSIALRYRDFVRARKHYGAVLKVLKDDPEALEAIGHCQAGKLEAADAAKSFKRVLQLRPKNARALYALAVVTERQLSKLEDAKALYQRWVTLKGGSARLGAGHKVVKKITELAEQIQMLKEFGDEDEEEAEGGEG
jgi:tetratricopeptide (TPR) repeat protein